MKNASKAFVALLIALLARLVVRKYRPKVVMVTGSVGKTSTKDALAAALAERQYLRASEKSYNSEFGVPLTIIGAKNPWTNPFAWLRVLREALALLLLPNHYPRILVLEVGADRPGDLAKILSIAAPDAVVVTRLPEVPVHVEAYASPEAVREEEFVPAYGLPPGAPLIVNAEDAYAQSYAARLPVSVRTFGFEGGADIEIQEPAMMLEEGVVSGMKAAIKAEGAARALVVKGALGRTQLLAPAAALATAISLGESLDDALAGLASYAPPPGRCRLLRGKGGSLLIDDSYNSSPAAVEEALAALSLVGAKRRIAVLGDMLELGRFSVAEHERIGGIVAKRADLLIVVGIRSRATADAARAGGMKEEAVRICDAAEAAAALMPDIAREGDVILVKGSQSMRMERVVEALLADPADRSKLVRQEREWKRR